MNIDELLARAVRAPGARLARAGGRRLLRRIGPDGPGREVERQITARAGGPVNLGRDPDPLPADASEADQIARAAHLARLARFAWHQATGDMTWSEEMLTMLGYPSGTVEPSTGLFLSHLHPGDRELACQAIRAAWANRCVVRSTYRMIRTDRTVVDIDCHLEVLLDADGQPCGLIGTGQDVTLRERARREVDRLRRRCETVRTAFADWDADTGLFTRRRFADEVDRALRFGSGAVLVVRIEPVGPGRPGAEAEDPGAGALDRAELLRAAARLIEGLKEPADLLGRIGSSEIAVLLPDPALAKSCRLAERFVASVRAQEFVTEAGRARANAWGGLVRYPGDAQVGSHDLLIDAESAWRRAKGTGQPIVILAQPVRAADRKIRWRDQIADALRMDQFTLYAQPILELESNRITRHELLLRVLDDVNGPLPPSAVLDAAERLDAVFEIDLWVLGRAMELLTSAADGTHLQVNLSGRSLGDARLLTAVDELFRRYRPDPARLTFEITETAVIGNLTEARRFAGRIREIGCQLALDDFGSGYGSFRYLKMFPVDVVKIDGEFIENLVADAQDQVMVRALVKVCQAYGIRTVAEFVQDEPTLEALRGMGVEFVQGYLIGQPAPLGDLATGAGPLAGLAGHQRPVPRWPVDSGEGWSVRASS